MYMIEALQGGFSTGLGQQSIRPVTRTQTTTTAQTNPLYQPTLAQVSQQTTKPQTTGSRSYADTVKTGYFPTRPDEEIPWTMIQRRRRRDKTPFNELSIYQQNKRKTISEMWKMTSPLEYENGRQIFISSVPEAAAAQRPSYNLMKDQCETWARNIGGKLEYIRGLASGDFLLQLDDEAMTYLRTRHFPEMELGLCCHWQPKPSHRDLSVPSVVVEGVDRFLSHRAVIAKIKQAINATWLGLTLEELERANLVFVRFHRKVEGGPSEPTASGRLIGPSDIISRIEEKAGIHVGYPCYARQFASKENRDNKTTEMEVDTDQRGAKRTTEDRETAKEQDMQTPEKEAGSLQDPPVTRQRTDQTNNEDTFPEPPITDLTREETYQETCQATSPPAREITQKRAQPKDKMTKEQLTRESESGWTSAPPVEPETRRFLSGSISKTLKEAKHRMTTRSQTRTMDKQAASSIPET